MEEHRVHVRKVLDALYKERILLKPEKCEFDVQSTKYLGYVLSSERLEMDPVKTSTIREWKRPTSVHDVQMFLGFANFYRRFISGYSSITRPLTALTGKGKEFVWNTDHQRAFETLKTAFTTAPVLQLFDFEKPCAVETEASDFVSAGVLSQPNPDGVLHPVAFFSKKHIPAECNYEIYDKELLAVVRAFEEWRPELEGAANPIEVLSDHRNLEYFMSKQDLNRPQARWSTFLSCFNYKIQYRPGRLGLKPDALTRCSEDLTVHGDPRLVNQSQTILKWENLSTGIQQDIHVSQDQRGQNVPRTLSLSQVTSVSSPKFSHGYTLFERKVLSCYDNDPVLGRILEGIRKRVKRIKKLSIGECDERQSLLHYRDRLYIPDDPQLPLHILKEHHNSPAAGHPGRDKTFDLIARVLFWPHMRAHISQYVRNCQSCMRAKAPNHAKYGFLHTLPVPDQPWQEISMDFVTGLPVSEGYDAIMVVVDRLTKMRHLIRCNTTVNSTDVAK